MTRLSSSQDDPQDAVVASQYKSDKNLFNKTAKEWTQNYASPKINEEKIGRLVEMGFTAEKCKVSGGEGFFIADLFAK